MTLETRMDSKLYLLAIFATVLSNNRNLVYADELTNINLKQNEVKSMKETWLSEVEAIRMVLQTGITVLKSDLESKVDRVLNEVQDMRTELKEDISRSKGLELAFEQFNSSFSCFLAGRDHDDTRGGLFLLYEPPNDKTSKMTVRPAKTRISLGVRSV